jgi:DNA-binding beta-propeller fold protein YncE
LKGRRRPSAPCELHKIAGFVVFPVVSTRRLAAAVVVSLIVSAAHAATFHARRVDNGIAVDLTVTPLAGSELREGTPARVAVRFTDTATGGPLRGINPAAWFGAKEDAASSDRLRCEAQVASFLGGNIFTGAALDLNNYDVVTLNEDPTISVVDPRFSYGGSRLLAMVELRSRGYDWALSSADRLFVTEPDANVVAAIDTSSWKLLKNLDAGAQPKRIAAQPHSDSVWVASSTTLAQLRGRDLTVASRIPIPAGEHELAFSAAGEYLAVTSSGAAAMMLVEPGRKVKPVTIALPSAPRSAAFSSASGMAYVLGADGGISVIDPKTHRLRDVIAAEAGASRIRFAPDGRYAFIVNTGRDLIQILDAATGRLVQRGKFEGGPFEVTFSDTLAYVRHLRSDVVLMVPLADLAAGKPISVVDFPAGQKAFGDAGTPTPADGIVPAPENGAVLVAHPADRSIYYYREGMAAPMGTFSNYGHEPRAVMVIDRTLREQSPGVFTTVTRLPQAGPYDAAVFVDAPRVVSCFDVAVTVDPQREAERRAGVDVAPLIEKRTFAAGSRVQLAFRLTDRATGKPMLGMRDAQILSFLASGGWTRHQSLTEVGEGRYETTIEPPKPGMYYVYVESAAAGLRANSGQFLVLEVQ